MEHIYGTYYLAVAPLAERDVVHEGSHVRVGPTARVEAAGRREGGGRLVRLRGDAARGMQDEECACDMRTRSQHQNISK